MINMLRPVKFKSDLTELFCQFQKIIMNEIKLKYNISVKIEITNHRLIWKKGIINNLLELNAELQPRRLEA